MMIRTAIFRFTASVALGALASHAMAENKCDSQDAANRPTVAELRDVAGNVLVSDSQGMVSGATGQRVPNKVRVTTTSKAGVTIAFDCGCNVTLKENERLDIELPRACPAVLAAVTAAAPNVALGAVPAATASTVASGGLLGPALFVGAGVGGYLVYRHNRNVSPN